MLKTYMNASMKQAFVTLWASKSAMTAVTEANGPHMSKAATGDLKRSYYFLNRAMERIIDGVDEKTRLQVDRIGRSVQIGILNNRNHQLDREAYERYLFGKEQVEDMAEMAMLAVCSQCDGSPRDGCRLFQAFKHLDVVEWDPKHSLCPYANAGNGDAQKGD
ncbi:DUF5651 domain-containing protein [Alicyclobacillus tolerans]|uniref:DUF5651 domain-containing protein n=1 Tax=Alicyclobacillus tolerans TaxID=90970 RepID=UPI001F17DDEB|nr:DUF5651 domain-containing protein [Alicyclobacillus tolerans]MCF8566888.1 DUF5651 domain-containing protein [Alicyclobacillus tolerans]